MAKSKLAKNRDFVLTIDDTDNVADLDNDSGQSNVLNPDFQFDVDGFDVDYETSKSKKQENTEEEDQLESILRKHGGLQKSKKEKSKSKRDGKQNSEDDEDAEGTQTKDSGNEEEDEEDEGEEGIDSVESNGGNLEGEEDEEEDEDEDEEEEGSEEEAESTEQKDSIATDKSGFFEDAPVSSDQLPFSAMNISRPVMKGIAEANYTSPTPIQSAVIPVGLLGKDIVAGAVTGSGKTAAYLIPTLERLVYRPQKNPATRVVILTPTRELAMQVFEVGQQLGKFINNLRFGLAVGGLSLRAQEQQLRTKPDIVVATPGRFIDHVRNSPSFSVDEVEVLILDEADRMLEEGFEAEVTEILKLIPANRQTMLFSATMNNSVQDLVKLSLKKPVRLMINPPKQAAKGLIQEFVRIRKQYETSRPAILVSLLRKLGTHRRTIVFVAQKRTAHVLRIIAGLLGIRVGELHGSLSQDQRLASIAKFKSLEVPVLICTDLASRGLDIPKIEIVINYELPSTYDIYLHRIGRSARAGRTGTAISFVGESTAERQVVKQAVSASNASKQKILGRNVQWDEVKSIAKQIEEKQDTVNEVLAEEKTVKELGVAERELERANNLVEHRDEIKSRPKRTWFESQTESRKKRKQAQAPKSNTKLKKMDKGDGKNWAYKKTKTDRKVASQRGANRAIMKQGARKLKG